MTVITVPTEAPIIKILASVELKILHKDIGHVFHSIYIDHLMYYEWTKAYTVLWNFYKMVKRKGGVIKHSSI